MLDSGRSSIEFTKNTGDWDLCRTINTYTIWQVSIMIMTPETIYELERRRWKLQTEHDSINELSRSVQSFFYSEHDTVNWDHNFAKWVSLTLPFANVTHQSKLQNMFCKTAQIFPGTVKKSFFQRSNSSRQKWRICKDHILFVTHAGIDTWQILFTEEEEEVLPHVLLRI